MSRATRPFRIGLVGCGRLAEVGYLPALARTAHVALGALADPDRARREHLGAVTGAPVFATAAELLASVAVDGLVLASPASAHRADAELAASRAIPALIEKPPAVDATEAAALAALTPAPWIAFNRRFDPGAVVVREAVTAAAPTRPLVVHAEIRYRRQSWGAHSVRDDALDDLGPHLVDWVRWVGCGEIVAVTARVVRDQRAVVELDTSVGRARLFAATDRPHAERLEVRDSTGRRLGQHRVGGLVAAMLGRLRPPAVHPLVASLARQLDAFAAAVRGEPSGALATAADGLAVMQVLDAARRSAARNGATVALATTVEA